MTTRSIAEKRALVFATRMRFSAESQVIKDTAIDKLIERQLYILHNEEGVTSHEIEQQEAICLPDETPVITRLDVEKSLKRLEDSNKIVSKTISNQVKYRLSEQALQEHQEIQESTEKRFSQIMARLFKNAPEGIQPYYAPFLECLCIIFSQLGETYVRLIKGDVGLDELLRSPIIRQASQAVIKKCPSIDKVLFKSAVLSFFQDTHPDYDLIKWNMAQNYYVAKALGLDPSGHILSKEVFGGAVFYLDTNVLINALEPKARHHGTFKAFSKACKSLQIQLHTCQISLDELRRVVDRHCQLIEKVADQISDDIAPKIRGEFFRIYREQLKAGAPVDFETLFSSFYEPMGELAQAYEVNLVDDSWFVNAAEEQEIQNLLQEIQREYKAKRGRPKYKASALHDALLLQWLQMERERSTPNTWLVTLDTSLPGFVAQKKGESSSPLAITLDALLQWISPMAIYEDADEFEVATIFSEAVKYQLLPRETYFDLSDFLVFAEMEWSCKELPSEDVEKCIRYVKAKAPSLDPSEAADREKIAREISRFFADPGRKYKEDLQRLESMLETSRLEGERQRKEFQREIKSRDEKIGGLTKNLDGLREDGRKQTLKQSALFRTMIVAFLFIIYETAIIYLVWKYGDGVNFLQNLTNSWVIIATGGIVGPALFWFILGKERILALGWPFTKLAKIE